jgi:hypothetical protein
MARARQREAVAKDGERGEVASIKLDFIAKAE